MKLKRVNILLITAILIPIIIVGFVNIQFAIAEDPDIDDDGYPNDEDEFPEDPNEWQDCDQDGVGDNADDFPNDPAASKDTDDDGAPDEWNPGKSEEEEFPRLTPYRSAQEDDSRHRSPERELRRAPHEYMQSPARDLERE